MGLGQGWAKGGEAYRVDHVEAGHHRAQVVVGGEDGLRPEVREEAWQGLRLGLGIGLGLGLGLGLGIGLQG